MTILDLPRRTKIEYPESDGKPMAETMTHRKAMNDVIEMLDHLFRDKPDVFVAGNLLFYYEENDPSSVIAPDAFVVKGIPKGNRRTYRLWIERRAPSVVFEFTSRSTRLEDTGNKKSLYTMLGVREYFLCDPLSEYLTPPLQGFVLERDEYKRILPESDGSLASHELNLRLKLEDKNLRLLDVATGERLLTPAEAMEKARLAEAELTQLRAELKRIKGETGAQET